MLLALHGAMATDSFDDAEAEVLRRVRSALEAAKTTESSGHASRDVPVVVTLDLHANVSDAMVREARALWTKAAA